MEYKREYNEDIQFALDRIDKQIESIYQAYLYLLSHCRSTIDFLRIKEDMQRDSRIRDLINQRCAIESKALPKIIITVDSPEEVDIIKERLGIK